MVTNISVVQLQLTYLHLVLALPDKHSVMTKKSCTIAPFLMPSLRKRPPHANQRQTHVRKMYRVHFLKKKILFEGYFQLRLSMHTAPSVGIPNCLQEQSFTEVKVLLNCTRGPGCLPGLYLAQAKFH